MEYPIFFRRKWYLTQFVSNCDISVYVSTEIQLIETRPLNLKIQLQNFRIGGNQKALTVDVSVTLDWKALQIGRSLLCQVQSKKRNERSEASYDEER